MSTWRFIYYDLIAGTQSQQEEPQGWDGSEFILRRDEETHGIHFDFSLTKLRVDDETFDLVDAAYEADGIDALVEIAILHACDDYAEPTEVYRGKILFLTYSRFCGLRCYAEFNLEPTACLMQFNSRLDQKVDMTSLKDFEGGTLPAYFDLVGIDMPSVVLPLNTFRNVEVSEISAGQATDTTTIPSGSVVNLPVISQVFHGFDFPSFTLDEINTWNGSLIVDTDASLIPAMFTASLAGNYRFDWNLAFKLFGSWGYTGDVTTFVQTQVVNLYLAVNGIVVKTINLQNLTCGWDDDFPAFYDPRSWSRFGCAFWDFGERRPTVQQFGSIDSFEVALNVADEVKFYVESQLLNSYQREIITSNDVTFCSQMDILPGSTFHIELPGSVTDPTHCKVFTINEVLSRCAEAYTGDCLRVYSEYLGRTDSNPYPAPADGCGGLMTLTKGGFIRELEKLNAANPPVMAISFKEAYDIANSVHCIGMGLEDDPERAGFKRIRVERLPYFYQDTVVLDLGEVGDVERRTVTERIISKFTGGYEKYEAEDTGGLLEFMTQREYRTSLKNANTQKTAVCKAIAGSYTIEITRRKSNVSTKDWKYDNEFFIIQCERGEGGILQVEVDNVEDGATAMNYPNSLYNVRLSPVRNAMRWLSYLLAGFKDPVSTDSRFVFTAGPGNIYARYEVKKNKSCQPEGAQVYGENEDVYSARTAEPILPAISAEDYILDFPLTFEEFVTLKNNPYGLVQFDCNGNTHRGWVKEVELAPVPGNATLTLIAQPE